MSGSLELVLAPSFTWEPHMKGPHCARIALTPSQLMVHLGAQLLRSFCDRSTVGVPPALLHRTTHYWVPEPVCYPELQGRNWPRLSVYLVYSGSIVPVQPLAWGKEELLLSFESLKVMSAACPACQVRDQSLLSGTFLPPLWGGE